MIICSIFDHGNIRFHSILQRICLITPNESSYLLKSLLKSYLNWPIKRSRYFRHFSICHFYLNSQKLHFSSIEQCLKILELLN